MAKHFKGPEPDNDQQDPIGFGQPSRPQEEPAPQGRANSGLPRAEATSPGPFAQDDRGLLSDDGFGAFDAPRRDAGLDADGEHFPTLDELNAYQDDVYPGHDEGLVRHKHRRRRKNRVPIIIAAVFGVLLVACAAYGFALYRSATGLKSQASSALSQVNTIQSSIDSRDFDAAAASALQLQSAASQMSQELDSPLWTLSSNLPVVGSDIQGIRTVVSVLEDASTNALIPLTAALQQTPMDNLVNDGTIDVAALSTLLSAIEGAAPTMQSCTERLDALPDMNIEQLQSVVAPAKAKLDGVNDTFQAAAGIAPVASSLLGANGDRTYLLAAQNTAELRASGGFPGSVGTLTISDGHISLGDFQTVYDVLNEDTSSSIAITDEEHALFYGYTRYSWDNSYNPDFGRVGEIWAVSYNERHDTHIDGVISITPSLVQKLLSALNTSVTLTDGTELDGSNATKVLEHDLYWKYLSNEATVSSSAGAAITDALFSEAAGLAFDKVLNNFDSNMLTKLAGVLTEGVADREVMVWMDDDAEQAAMENVGATGALDAATQQQPTLGVFSNIYQGSKLGWWLGIETQVGNAVTAANGSRTYHVTTTVSNYLTGEELASGGAYIMNNLASTGGQLSPFMYFYAPAGGTIENIQASNGAQLSEAQYNGIQVFYTPNVGDDTDYAYPNFPLAAGEVVTVSYDVVLPAAVEGDLQVTSMPTLQQYRV